MRKGVRNPLNGGAHNRWPALQEREQLHVSLANRKESICQQLKSFLLLIQKLTTRPRVTISLQAFRHVTFIVPLASDKTCAQKEKMIELMTGKVEAPWSTLLVEMRPDQS